jgi:hypothetical protein
MSTKTSPATTAVLVIVSQHVSTTSRAAVAIALGRRSVNGE